MAIRSKEIGWSEMANLLYEISKELEKWSCALCKLQSSTTASTTTSSTTMGPGGSTTSTTTTTIAPLSTPLPPLHITTTTSTTTSYITTTTTTTTTPIYSLTLKYNDTKKVPVDDPTDVTQWNTFFGLPGYGNEFTSVSVDLSVPMISLVGGSNIILQDGLFSLTLIYYQ